MNQLTKIVSLDHSLSSISKLLKISSTEDALKHLLICARRLERMNSELGFGQNSLITLSISLLSFESSRAFSIFGRLQLWQ